MDHGETTPENGGHARRRLRYLVLAPQPFFVPRGTPIAVRLLLETLSERGDEMDVLTFPDGEPTDIPNCRILRIPALPGTRNIGPGFSSRKLLADLVLAPMVAWRLLVRRYDVVIAVEEAAYITMLLRPILRVPYIFDVDSSIPEQINDKRPLPAWLLGFLNWFERRTARNALAAFTCCRALEDLVRDHAPGLPIQTLEDITMLEPPTGAPPPPDVPSDVPVVMYVGNLESYQGVDLLIDGFAGLDPDLPAALVVIGGGADHVAAAKAKAEAFGLAGRAHFLGPRPVEQLGVYLRAAAIVASPRTQGRNTPMKVYSYLDSGRPLIATRLPTHTQVLDDNISMLVEPDAADMARGLDMLLRDPDLRERLAETAGQRVRAEFSRAGYARKLNTFLDAEILPRL